MTGSVTSKCKSSKCDGDRHLCPLCFAKALEELAKDPEWLLKLPTSISSRY